MGGAGRALRRQQALKDLALMALDGGSVVGLVDHVVETVGEVLPAVRCEVRLPCLDRPLSVEGAVPRASGALVVGGGRAGDSGADERVLTVAVHAGRVVFGALAVQVCEGRELCADDVRFLEEAAAVLGAAVEKHGAEEEARRAVDEERRRAEASRERLNFLHQASATLSTCLKPNEAFGMAARLAVPDLADWCFVDTVVDDGSHNRSVRRVVVEHVDPGEEELAEELKRHCPSEPGDPCGAPRVLALGRPQLIEEVDDDFILGLARNVDHLHALRRLGPCSYMCVPLQLAQELVGAVSFVSTRSGRRYGREDLLLAEGLVRCATSLVCATSRDPYGAPPRRGRPGTREDFAAATAPTGSSSDRSTPRALRVSAKGGTGGEPYGGKGSEETKVLLADGQPATRLGLRVLLQEKEGARVVGEARSATEVLDLCRDLHPDLVILDPDLEEGASASRICKRLKILPRPPRVLLYAASSSEEDVAEASLAGADGYLHKGLRCEELSEAVRAAHNGQKIWLLGPTAEGQEPKLKAALEEANLTSREEEILSLLLKRHGNREIADKLCLSRDTVKTHVRSVLRKLGCGSRQELFEGKSF